jgi:outer membrane PBP1 activator LpoA protein
MNSFLKPLALALVAVSLTVTGCPSSTSETVTDPSQMTPEQQAEQDAYLEEMDQ